ncbi:uncharacterized protein LOC133450862 [Cololabis saira]|uniref:uncharacterized protein LOC133450862 n=1 Tax=Cololabis saira TaxID=129043 RepID=UPI002AD4EA1D|nr:uncharacterized protein LOC133450862 [Cololabis saira]
MGSSSSSDASNGKFFDKNGKEVKPGDLIEIFRGLFKHWAVYVGGGNVVHLVPPGGVSGSISGGDVGLVGEGKVWKEKLEKVVEKNMWRVNNLLDDKYTPRPADDIVKTACSLEDTKKQYNLVIYNCEHFATDMRYGKPESRQVWNKAAAAAAGAVAGLAVAGPVGAVVGAVGAVAGPVGAAVGPEGAVVGPVGSVVGAVGAVVGAVGAVVGPVGAVVGPEGAVVGPVGSVVGAVGAVVGAVGAVVGPVGAVVGPVGAVVGPVGAVVGAVGAVVGAVGAVGAAAGAAAGAAVGARANELVKSVERLQALKTK